MKLPIDDHLGYITETILAKQNVVIQSSPGSGKTTRIPPHLFGHFKNILVVEPRRIAAIYAASRIAEEKKWPLGAEVGYEVRFDSRRSDKTRILFLTEALLAKKILSDPQMDSVDLIIFDEFHERSYWTDLAVGHLKELQILGSSIKMLFLSATIDQVPLISFFEDLAIIDIKLPRFPIEIIHQKKPFRYSWGTEFETNLVSALLDLIQKGKKQILVFLPGLKEIRNASKLLETQPKFKTFQIEVLHGSLPLAQQKSIVTNDSNFEYRIIFSTNIAESSLTISGVTAVLDSGLHREASYNTEYEETQLQTRKISQFSAIQRQGRANRLGPGIVVKMWTEIDEKSMDKAPISDIKKSSLFDLGLQLLKMGHWPLSQFTWFEIPPANVLNELEENYREQNLVSSKKLSPLGEFILDLNLTYESALLLALSKSFYSFEKAALMVAILESEFSAPESGHSPLSTLLEAVDFYSRNRNQPQDIEKRVTQLVTGFNRSRLLKNWNTEFPELFKSNEERNIVDSMENTKDQSKRLELIIAFSYRTRLCKRRIHEGSFSNRAITTRSKEVVLGENRKSNQLPPFEYFINFKTIVDSNQIAKCFSFHFVDPVIFDIAIRPVCKKESRIEFVEDKQRFYKVTDLTYKKIVIATLTHDPLDPFELKEKTKEIFLSQKDSLLFTIPMIDDFLIRLGLVNQGMGSPIFMDWEEILDQEIKKGLDIRNRLEWSFDLEGHLSYENQKLIKSLVPREIAIKALNRSFRVHYPKNETPFIESRLQHFLGLNTHPMIMNNQLKLKVVLLGPHGRPIQITNDLPGFWTSSYPDIRKEMKGRYPRHPWPEDPANYKF